MSEYKALRQRVSTLPSKYWCSSFKQCATDYTAVTYELCAYMRTYKIVDNLTVMADSPKLEPRRLKIGNYITLETILLTLVVYPEYAKKVEESLKDRLAIVNRPIDEYLVGLDALEKDIVNNYRPDQNCKLGTQESTALAVALTTLFIHHFDKFDMNHFPVKYTDAVDDHSHILPEINCGIYTGFDNRIVFVLKSGELTYHSDNDHPRLTYRSLHPLLPQNVMAWMPNFAEELYLLIYYITYRLTQKGHNTWPIIESL